MIRPRKRYSASNSSAFTVTTPAQCTEFSKELKQALNERNALTAKSRRKCKFFFPDFMILKIDHARTCLKNGASLHNFTNKHNLFAVCDMLDPDNSPAKSEESKKRIIFRRQAVHEILSSERSYLQHLDTLMHYFVLPLKAKQLISYVQFNALFGQLEMIYNLNRELLTELEANLDNVAKAFLRMAPFFKLYSVYAFDYNKSQLILQELTEKNVAFRKFLEKTESRPEVQTKLISLLITPIQRVPRYRLLLQQVAFYSSPTESDFKILQGE